MWQAASTNLNELVHQHLDGHGAGKVATVDLRGFAVGGSDEVVDVPVPPVAQRYGTPLAGAGVIVGGNDSLVTAHTVYVPPL